MATVKGSNQISIVDVTDAYSVILTSEAYTFVGGTGGVGSGSSCSTQAVAYCGTNQCSTVTVDASAITCPTGISATVANSGTSAPTITFTTTATISSACEATIPVTVDGMTINKQFSFAVAIKGATGATGSSSRWYSGTAITGTSTTATAFSNSGISAAIVGDMYLNTSTYNTYRCTTAGAASAAKWVYVANIKGTTGTTGSQWYSGTAITGTSTTAAVFSGTGISSARVNDMYLNTSTGNTYKCTTAGAASAAKWVYAGSIKGATGATGAKGAAGADGADGADAIVLSITTSNGTVFKNSSGSTVLTAHVYQGGAECTISDAGAVTNAAGDSLGSIKWYVGSSTSATATASTLTVNASDVTNVQAYTAKLEE